MAVEDDLLDRGYFPKEIQPPFTTKTLAAYIPTTTVAALDTASKAPGSWWTAPVKHNLARAGGLRRPIAIPNPIGFVRVARELEKLWKSNIEPLLASAEFSASRPIPSAGPRAFSNIGAHDADKRRAMARRSERYVLHADIQNFYPGIYTHSIPWALNGKAASKTAMKAKPPVEQPGDALDRFVRGCQEGQTNGISIGPDSSLVIAECISAAIDNDLLKRFPSIKGYRWIDDYELCFPSVAEAEAAQTTLQELLAEYQLSLNSKKTRIAELPEPQERGGIWQIRRWDFSTQPTAQASDIVGFFDKVFSFMREGGTEHIASFAVVRISRNKWAASNWPLVESMLFQLLVAEPSCARFVVEMVAIQRRMGMPLDRDGLQEAVQALCVRHAQLKHGSEVAWAIWASITNEVAITDKAAKAISQMEESVVALLALHAKQLKLTPAALDTSKWEKLMSTDELRKEHWLLAYEASIKSWLPGIGGVDHVGADPFFSALRHAGVTFYDAAATALPINYREPTSMGAGPVHSLAWPG